MSVAHKGYQPPLSPALGGLSAELDAQRLQGSGDWKWAPGSVVERAMSFRLTLPLAFLAKPREAPGVWGCQWARGECVHVCAGRWHSGKL